MNTHTRCSACALALALTVAPATVSGEPPGCSVKVYEFHAKDGIRRVVEETRCSDRTIRSVERRYDASNHLVGGDGYEISADGAVRPIAKAVIPKVSPRVSSADSRRVELWLNSKFKEWNEAAERQVVAGDPNSKLPEARADRMGK